MLIRTTVDETTLQCDGCGVVFYCDSPDASEARLIAEADGWRSRIAGDTVADYCVACAEG